MVVNGADLVAADTDVKTLAGSLFFGIFPVSFPAPGPAPFSTSLDATGEHRKLSRRLRSYSLEEGPPCFMTSNPPPPMRSSG